MSDGSTKELGVVTKIQSAHFLYQITLADRSRVYMRLSDGDFRRDSKFVVIVDSERFLQLWRNSDYEAHWEIAHGTPVSWRLDYKFKDALQGFTKGIVNPVPLADVSCYLDTKKSLFGVTEKKWCVGFTNGITRTIYLLSCGAKSFPVMCLGKEEAHNLHAQAGVVHYTPKSLEQLIPLNISCTSYLLENGFIDFKTHEVDRFKLVREKWGGHSWWNTDLEVSKGRCPYE